MVADAFGSIEVCESIKSFRLFFARSAIASATFNGSLFVALVFMWYYVSAFGFVFAFNREVIFREVFINRQKNQQKCTYIQARIKPYFSGEGGARKFNMLRPFQGAEGKSL